MKNQSEVIWTRFDWKCDLAWPLWPQKLKFFKPCWLTYQLKGNDTSSWYVHMKIQAEVIWPRYDWKSDLRWPPWPYKLKFYKPCQVMTPEVDLFQLNTNFLVIWLEWAFHQNSFMIRNYFSCIISFIIQNPGIYGFLNSHHECLLAQTWNVNINST